MAKFDLFFMLEMNYLGLGELKKNNKKWSPMESLFPDGAFS